MTDSTTPNTTSERTQHTDADGNEFERQLLFASADLTFYRDYYKVPKVTVNEEDKKIPK